MNIRTSLWLVWGVIGCLLAAVCAQEQTDRRAGQSIPGRERRALFLEKAQQTPAAEWPDWKKEFLANFRQNMGRGSGNSSTMDQTVTRVGQLLDEAHTLSPAAFGKQKQALLDHWDQALRILFGGSGAGQGQPAPPCAATRSSQPQTVTDVQPDALFTEGAVLQRNAIVPVWGTAKPGTRVTVDFCGQTLATAADPKGQWLVRLSKLAAGGPFSMIIRGQQTLALTNICVGDIWVCSGQSNMEFPLKYAFSGAKAIPAANDSQLRFFAVPEVAAKLSQHSASLAPANAAPETCVSAWQECTPQSAAEFSAVGYFFGRDLRPKIGVPLGLILCARHSTYAEAWADRPTLQRILPQAFERDAANARNAEQGSAHSRRREDSPIGPDQLWNRPCIAFDGMLTPLLRFPITGVIWYQGEANSFNTAQTKEYQTLLPAVIGCWRKAWGLGDFPFLTVQHPGGFIPELREAQFVASQRTKNSAVIVTADHGPTADDPVGGTPWWNNERHPKDKEPVGVRLALAARALAYGEKIEYSGPVFKRMSLGVGKAVLSFDHVGTGLVAKDSALKGFTVAGADKRFVAGDAAIHGDTVVVSSARVPRPVAVRYGWANNPECTLFNKEGLPAAPFRTDAE